MPEPLEPVPSHKLFAEPASAPAFPATAVAIAGVAVLVLVGALLLLGRRQAVNPNTVLRVASYAPSLALTDLEMSESTSLSGGKSTYIDGKVTNRGPSTVLGITVQVLFRNDEAMPPQVETLPLALIRTGSRTSIRRL